MVWLTDVIVVCEAEYPQSAPVSRPVVVSSAVLTPPTTVPTRPPTRPPSPPSRSACAGGAAPAVRLTLATARRPAGRRTRMAIREGLRSPTCSPPSAQGGVRRTVSDRLQNPDDRATEGN